MKTFPVSSLIDPINRIIRARQPYHRYLEHREMIDEKGDVIHVFYSGDPDSVALIRCHCDVESDDTPSIAVLTDTGRGTLVPITVDSDSTAHIDDDHHDMITHGVGDLSAKLNFDTVSEFRNFIRILDPVVRTSRFDVSLVDALKV